MFKNILQKAGLTPTQAMILEHLFEAKDAKASDIAHKIGKSRAIVYKDLDELCALKIVERSERRGQVAVFRLGHPSNMENYFEQAEKKLKKDRELFNNYLPDMVSAYNLMSNKPGVRFYEGEEGIIKLLEEVANNTKPNSEILSFTKVLEDEKALNLNEALKKFVKKRIRKNIKTRVIALDTEKGRTLKSEDSNNLRETRLVTEIKCPFDFPGGEIMIYEDEISFVSIGNGSFFAVNIKNGAIYQLLKTLFESEWLLLALSDKAGMLENNFNSDFLST